MIEVKATAQGVTFSVIVQLRASKAAIVGSHDKALKIKLTAPPVEGAANKQCIELLSKALGRPKSTLEIISGDTSRHKQILVRAKAGAMSIEEREQLKEELFRLGNSDQKTP
ncbi:MAG: DUF167 domain-containing protein [Desulfobacteraceae bacterium]|nr:DUF167 domain-containing protein [Desulfobacteraceae bacterium]